MTQRFSGPRASGSLALLLVVAVPIHAPDWDTLTLISPNEETGSLFGASVSGAGDVDHDGAADVIVGASHEDPGTSPNDAGRAYIFRGQDGGLLYELVSPNEESEGHFGNSVAAAGDVNRDGVADVIFGASSEGLGPGLSLAGRAYVFSGQDGGLLFGLSSPNHDNGGSFGSSVAGAGDLDQDAHGDVIVGAPGEHLGGRAYVFSGQDGSLVFQLSSPNAEDGGEFGTSVSGTADVNSDGIPDLIVGADWEDLGGVEQAGRAYVFSGADGSVLLALNSPNAQGLAGFGSTVAGVGDVNRDGSGDVIVGAPSEGIPFFGRAYVSSGRDGSLLLHLESPNKQGGGHFGNSVAGAGDVNQDGMADVIVGAVDEDPGTSPQDAGRAYVLSGRDGSLLVELISPSEEAGGGFGRGVAAADVNLDGIADPIVGASGKGRPGAPTCSGRTARRGSTAAGPTTPPSTAACSWRIGRTRRVASATSAASRVTSTSRSAAPTTILCTRMCAWHAG